MYKKNSLVCREKVYISNRILLIMKLIGVLMITAFLQLSHATGYAQRVTIAKKESSLLEVLTILEKQTSFNFAYNSQALIGSKPVTINVKNATVTEVLDKCFENQKLTYILNGNTIVIQQKTEGAKQESVLTGKIRDEQGNPLQGVSVRNKTTNATVISATNGDYRITVNNDKDVLLFTLLGYTAKEQTVGVRRMLDVVLQEQSQELTEVVVTALGIKREEKSLGYAVTKLDSNQFTDAVSGNWLDALSGKVPGLNMVRSNGGPTGSNKVILRGENNLTGENEALIVLDGVVLNSGSGRRTASGSSSAGPEDGVQPTDFGSGINDINPEDIESVTVLRGPGASALYGQRGANGAIIITTKSGSKKKNVVPSITFSTNVSMEQANRWPDLQYEYGQGLNGASTYTYGTNNGTSLAWGPRFNGQSFIQYDPNTQSAALEATPWVPYKNQIREFFDTGKTWTNSLSVSGKLGKSTYRVSATHTENDWIIPNTGYRRSNVSLSTNSQITSKLNLALKANYTNKFSDNLPGMGYGNQSVMYWYVFWVPNGDINWLNDYWVKGKENEELKDVFTTSPENPYAISYEFINGSNRNGYLGNMQLTYDFTKDLSLQLRATLDRSDELRQQKRPYTAARLPKGSYRTQDIDIQEISADFLLKYNKKINDDIQINTSVGGSLLRNRYYKDEKRADGLIEPNVYSFDNAAYDLLVIPDTSRFHINSIYGLMSTSYKDYLYLDLTARQDWSSTLANPVRRNNVGFFYPSASLSFVASDYFKLPKSIFDLAKARFSFSQTGSSGTIPYRTAYTYPLAGSGIYPDNSLMNPTTLPNPDLKPLMTITYEVGADVRMFKKRLGLDVAFYKGHTKNQILDRIVDRSSGYTRQIINAGQINNQGVEVALDGTPIQTKNFKWKVFTTFSHNKNKIISMANTDSTVILRSAAVGGAQIVAKVGGSLGDMYGIGFERSPDGQVVYDANSGLAKLADQPVYLGSTIPKYRGSVGSEFSYKGFRLNVLFDMQLGAVGHSYTHGRLADFGKLTATLPGRYSGIIGEGVVMSEDGRYSPNTTIATDITSFYNFTMGTANGEGATYKTDFIKFREARIDYSLPKSWLKSAKISRVTAGLYGRNLFIWSKWPMFDPEFGTLSGTDIVQGFEVGQFPSTRTFGFNLVVGFN